MDPSRPPVISHRTPHAGPPHSSGDLENQPPPRMGRALLVGLAGICVNILFIQHVGFYLSGSALGVDYLPVGAFCLFVVLVGINGLLGRAGIGLTRTEIVVVYVMMLVTSGMAHSGFASRLVPSLAAVFEFASETNDWVGMFHRYLPRWIAPHDPAVAHLFYTGSDGGTIPWGEWALPLATWLVPTSGMAFLMFGLAILLRKRWLEEERLTFPLVQVPLAVLGDEKVPGFNKALRRDAVFWIAFGVPVTLRLLQGMHHYFPGLPGSMLNVSLDMEAMFDSPTWRDLFNSTRIQVHLALIGIAILMRQEVSASFWVFQWFYLGVGIVMYLVGIGGGSYINTPQETFGYNMFIYYTRLGATLAAAVTLIWAARNQIARAFRLIRHPRASLDPDEGPLRWAVWMLVLGAVLYLGWAHIGGMDLKTALVMFGIHTAVIIVLARIVADGGLFWASLSLDPMRSVVRFLGTDWMSGRTLTFVALSNHVPMAARSNILPSIMDSLQMGHRTGVNVSRLLRAMAVAIAAAAVVSLVALLWMSYDHGAYNLDLLTFQGIATYPFWESSSYLQNAAHTNVASIMTAIAGAALMLLFIAAHRRLVWWPVYPFGFAIAESVTMECIWFSIFLGWAIRVLIVRSWGSEGYRRIRPAAFGVIVGDFLSIGLWALVDVLMGEVGNSMTHEISAW